ncbi:MAG: hypothetical protein ABI267_04480, partial [Ginsengibacter sp.]
SATKLEDEIQKAHFNRSNYKSLLNSIFNKVYNEEILLQKKYDAETRNSVDTAKQKDWNHNISAQIQKLKMSTSK